MCVYNCIDDDQNVVNLPCSTVPNTKNGLKMNWLNDNAGAIQGLSALAQAITTAVLVLITINYARSTKDIASKTRDMATATERMTELTNDQRLDNTLPVIGFRLADGAQTNVFQLIVINLGAGPALDLTITIDDAPIRYTWSGPILPTALAVGEGLEITYRFRQDNPFQNESLKWPQNKHDRALIENEHRSAADYEAHSKRHAQFLDEVRIAASKFQVAGTVRAVYRDVHGRQLVSSAPLELELDPKYKPDAWKSLKLGTLDIINPK